LRIVGWPAAHFLFPGIRLTKTSQAPLRLSLELDLSKRSREIY